METKIGFLVKAIEEVQETNRFLDTKAGVLIVFETSLLAVAVYSLFDKSTVEFVRDFTNRITVGYLVFMVFCFVSYIVALIIHILLSLRIIFPQENPELHVDLTDFEPKRLFFLYKLNGNQQLRPSVMEYSKQLVSMNDDDITNEYIFELLKLSYIRKLKSDRLKFSFHYLAFLIVGIMLLAFTIVFGLFM